MKTISQYIKEHTDINKVQRSVLYEKDVTDFQVPEDLSEFRWQTMSFGQPGKEIYDDLKKAIDEVLLKDRASWSDIESISWDEKFVTVNYAFGLDSIGFSLKAV